MPDDAGAEVLVAPRQHAVPDPVAQVQVKLIGVLRDVQVVLRSGPEPKVNTIINSSAFSFI